MSKKILLIDDDEDEMHFLKEALGDIRKSFTCFFASGVMEGISLANRVFPDMIFLDINMPKVNGYEGLSMLKKSAQQARVPVILYSTAVNEEVQRKATLLGASACIKKTGSIRALSQVLKELFNRMQEQESHQMS